MIRTLVYFALPLFVSMIRCYAQGTLEDYERAYSLERRTAGKVTRESIEPHWLPNDTAFWYRNDLGEGRREWVWVDCERGERKPAFDLKRLAESLAKEFKRDVDHERIDLTDLVFEHEHECRFRYQGKTLSLDLRDHALRAVDTAKLETQPAIRALERIESSRSSSQECEVKIANETRHELKFFWIDERGREKFYFDLAPGASREQHTFHGHVWLARHGESNYLAALRAEEGRELRFLPEMKTERRERPERDRPAYDASREESPARKHRVRIENHNLSLGETSDPASFQPLTSDGTAENAYRRWFWSPDGTHLLAVQATAPKEREITIVESTPKDQLHPKVHTFPYVKPGDELPRYRLHLVNVAERKVTSIDDELYREPFSLNEFRWTADSQRCLFLFNERGHRVLRLGAIKVETRTAETVIEERQATFVDYAHKAFHRVLEDSHELLWMSERDGWNRVYLCDFPSGRIKNALTSGDTVLRGVERVDVKSRRIWLKMGGLVQDEDPYYIHLARVDFDGSNFTRLTEGNGTHTWQFSPNGKYLIDRWSRIDQPPVHTLRNAETGALICELERADASKRTAAGYPLPEPFAAPGRDGKTPIYGAIYRPSNFDPAKKYPIVEEVYAGPQGAYVRKDFGRDIRRQMIAELGFIVVQADGMGTSYRSKAFHDVCARNLADGGFPDRMDWIKAAAAKYPQMDLTRVGIYGGSAGGQNAARALIAHGDFYQAAVADCGCHDNRMDKIWWNELWMGYPIGPHYAEQSNATQAHRLQGKLLLTVGELDRNVDPASTKQLAAALVKARKEFDLLVIPGGGHGSGETPYAARRRLDFFVRHLLKVEPPSLHLPASR